MSKLMYKKPASVWEEALPLGNGRLGAMIFGSVLTEQLQLNEDSVWYGGYVDRNNPDALNKLPIIRELLLKGEIKEAEELMSYALSGTPQSQRHYQTLGDLNLSFKGLDGQPKAYERSLSLDEAVHRVQFRMNGVEYVREAFITAADNVLVVRLTASEAGRISFQALLSRGRYYDAAGHINNDTIFLDGNLGQGGLNFSMVLKAIPEGGTCDIIGEHLIIREADAVTLLFTAGTTFRYTDVRQQLINTLQAATAYGYEELKDRHIKAHQELYGRVTFQLAGNERYDGLPTDERLENVKHGIADTGLLKLYFDYGRYLLISCSREGSLPANLQGIWNKDFTPAWDSKYTININTEMNYWPAEACNLSECHQPLFDLMKRMLPNGQVTARKMYGCRGFVAHHNTDIWGDTAVQDIWIPASYWVMGAAWLCTHQWMHYEYTKDIKFLEEAYPIMKEAAVFFLDFLIEDKGYLKTCPSVSPENTYILPNGQYGSACVGATMDNQILRDLFNQCIEAAKLLGVQDELTEQMKEARDKLTPTRIGRHGSIMEWEEDYEEMEPGHRHISHLYGLHPSSQITMDKTPELAEAAKVTLERRLSQGGGHTGWSRAWIINMYARLWDGEAAQDHLLKLLSNSTLPNMFDNHPPFQIDGNFGATAGIAEMLVQSTADRIVLLPALPKSWPDGSIQGLCVRGGAEISLEWQRGQLKGCTIKTKHPIAMDVIYQEKKIKISLPAGEEKPLMLY